MGDEILRDLEADSWLAPVTRATRLSGMVMLSPCEMWPPPPVCAKTDSGGTLFR